MWIRHYPRENFPNLATNFEDLVAQGVVISVEEVLNELSREDRHGLAEWGDAHKKMFLRPDDCQIEKAQEIIHKYPKFLDHEKEYFDADPYIVALAMCEGCVVVHEERARNLKQHPDTIPKIPDICDVYGIEDLSVLEFIKEQKWRF